MVSIPVKHMMPRESKTAITVRGWDTLFTLHVGGSTASLCKAEGTWLRDRLNEWLDGRQKPSPDFRSLKVGDTVQFDEGNSLVYYRACCFVWNHLKALSRQDLGWHRGVPHDVVFVVDEIITDWSVKLVGPGYGGEPYGNGKIIVYFDQEQETPRYRDDGAWRM